MVQHKRYLKRGDKVRLTDEGIAFLPSPENRAEAEARLGVLTVTDVAPVPVDDYKYACDIETAATEKYLLPCWMVELVEP